MPAWHSSSRSFCFPRSISAKAAWSASGRATSLGRPSTATILSPLRSGSRNSGRPGCMSSTWTAHAAARRGRPPSSRRSSPRWGTGCDVQVGGGLRDEASVASALATGATRAVVGTAAIDDPRFAGRLVERHGVDRIAVALDVRDGLAIGSGWRTGAPGVPVVDAATRITDQGVITLVVTAIERDGLLGGPDLELLGRLVAFESADIVASGGIGSTADVLAAQTSRLCRGDRGTRPLRGPPRPRGDPRDAALGVGELGVSGPRPRGRPRPRAPCGAPR